MLYFSGSKSWRGRERRRGRWRWWSGSANSTALAVRQQAVGGFYRREGRKS